MSADLIAWADEIVVMEPKQARQLRKRFGPELREKRVVSLDIADRYSAMQPELIEQLQAKAARRLGLWVEGREA